MKWRSVLPVVTCLLLVVALANAATLAKTPEAQSALVSTAQLPFCVADLSEPQVPSWNPSTTTAAFSIICGPCSSPICRGAIAGVFCDNHGDHCNQVDNCSDGITYYCTCSANNF